MRWLLPICDKYQNLTCWSNLHLIALYTTLNKISNYCFHLNAIVFFILLLSKNKSEIRFQYLVYYIIHTCNIYGNGYTAIYVVFMICVCLFSCFTSQINSYGHGGTVSSPYQTFSSADLNKRLTSNLCTYFRV